MTAIVISGYLPDLTTGGGIAILSSLSFYSHSFSKVFLFCPANSIHDEVQKFYNLKNIIVYPIKLSRHGIFLRFIQSFFNENPAITVRFRKCIPNMLRKISVIISQQKRRGQPIVVIYEDISAALIMEKVKSRWPFTLNIIRSHNVHVKAFQFVGQKRFWLHDLVWNLELSKIRKFEKKVLLQADKVWAISDEDAQEYILHYNFHPHGILGIAIDINRYRDIQSDEYNTIIFIGSADLRKGKGISEFIADCFPLIRKSVSDVKLILGGRGTKKFSDKKNGIEGLGYVYDEKEILRRGKIFINPQTMGSGIKLKSIISLLAKKVLVSTEVGIEGIKGTSGNSFIVAPNWIKMAKEIINLLNDYDRMESLSNTGFEEMEKEYSLQSLISKSNHLLKS